MFFSGLSFSSRRAKLVSMGLTGLMLTHAATVVAQTEIQAAKADRFVDSMGVNVHMEALSTPYKYYGAINAKLRSLGMRHVRDEINDADLSFGKEIRRIGRLGYTVCGLIEGGNDYPGNGSKLEADLVVPMIRSLLPVIDAVEGPNEPDDPTPLFAYDGACNPPQEIEACYPRGAIKESEDLWNIVKRNPEISDLPVVVMSEGSAPDFRRLARLTPPPIDYATFGNLHAYQGGDVGDSGLADSIRYSQSLTGRAPLWTTEMGYHNNTRYLSDGEQQGVSERASAIYLPIAFLSAFSLGVLRTFSYELIDEFDPHLFTDSGEGHYGLLHYDGTPKPAFIALKNLIALLRQRESEDFEPGSLPVRVSGAPRTMHYTLLQKSNGDYYLALWNDVRVYKIAYQDGTKTVPGRDVYPPNVPVTLTFSSPYAFRIYAPADSSGINPTDRYTISTTAYSIKLDLPPEVLLVKIAGDR
jgi:hypothetical protein